MRKYSGFVVRFLGVQRPVSLPRVAANFYLMYEIVRALQNSRRAFTAGEWWNRRFNEYVERWSQVFVRYAFVACVGEARHRCTDRYVPAFVRSIPRTNNYDKTTRYSVQSRVVRRYARRFEKIASSAFEDLRVAFLMDLWSTNYGGPKWAQVANLGALLSRGKISPVVFVDQIFDVVHNAGYLFDKALFYNGEPVFVYEGIMREMLSYKEPKDPYERHWRFVPMMAWGDYTKAWAWYEIVGKYTSIDLELVDQYRRYYSNAIRCAKLNEEG